MKKIKIAHIITRMIVGGAQENTLFSCRELAKDPHYEVTLITGPSLGPEGNLLETLNEKESFNLILLPSLSREINPFRDLVAFFQLWKLCRTNQFDLVHTHSSKAGILGRWAAFFSGIKHRFHTVHGWGFHPYQSRWLRALYIFSEQITALITSKLITVSKENSVKGLKHHIGTKKQYTTIYSGINVSQFKSLTQKETKSFKDKNKIPKEKIVIGTVGRFVTQKNPIFFFEVAQTLLEKNKDLFFLMVGDGPQKERLTGLIEKEGLNNAFLLPGLQSKIEAWIQSLDILFLPSKWEGLPRVLLQAMAAGKCVVCSDADGIREVIQNKENGLMVNGFNKGTWQTVLNKVIRDPSLRASLGKEAEKTVTTQFSDDKMIQDLKRLIQQTMGES